MTENEFLELYEASYRDILNEYIQLVKDNSTLQYKSLFNKTLDYNHEIFNKSNLLISQLIKKNGLEDSRTETEIALLSSDLYRKAFNIILDCDQYYKSLDNSAISNSSFDISIILSIKKPLCNEVAFVVSNLIIFI